MKTPTITVLMPVYNAGIFLHKSIPSVLNQTFKNFEFLILDDGSTDNSPKIIKQYRDSRIRFIQKNNNFIDTLNTGLKQARGKYIARMDSDDIMIAERLEEQFSFMETNPEIDICGTNAKAFGEKDHIYTLCYDTQKLTDLMILGNQIIHPTVMMRTSTLRKRRFYYKEEYKYAEDYKLWTEIAERGPAETIKADIYPLL